MVTSRILYLFFLTSILLFQHTPIKAIINFKDKASKLKLKGKKAKLKLSKPLKDISGTLEITDKESNSITQTTSADVLTFATTGLLDFGFKLGFSGEIDLNNDSLLLRGGKSLNLINQKVLQEIRISGTDNIISGSPLLSRPIILQDSTTTVTLALDAKLTGSIQMNGGSIYLEKDLILKDDIYITGSGSLIFNGHSLQYPVYSNPITDSVELVSANDIWFYTHTSKTSDSKVSGTSTFRGTGVILDLTGGGTYTFKKNSTTYLNNLHIKGLGSRGGGELKLDDSNVEVYLHDCILELDGSYTQTEGRMVFIGGNNKIITHPGENFIVNGSNTILEVNGQRLYYENIGESPRNPLTTTSGGTISTPNNGEIISNYIPTSSDWESSGGGGPTTLAFSSTEESSIDKEVVLDKLSSITFSNATTGTPKAMILNGNYNSIKFSNSSTTTFIVEENITLTLKNIKLENFDPARFNLQGSGGSKAKYEFKDNVTIEIEKDLTLTAEQLLFSGTSDCEIYSNNNSTIILASQALKLSGAQQVKMKNLKCKTSASDSIKVTNANATLQLQSSDLVMTNAGITWNSGNIKILDHVRLRGASETTPETTLQFNFTTPGNLTILSNSTLEINHDIEFAYNPNTTGNTSAQSKRHFIMTDPSSTLLLNKAIINAGAPGIAFDYGKILIQNACFCKTSHTEGKEFELGSFTNTTILNNGSLSVDGILKYTPSTFP